MFLFIIQKVKCIKPPSCNSMEHGIAMYFLNDIVISILFIKSSFVTFKM